MVRRDAGAAAGAARAGGVPHPAGIRGGAAAVDRRGRHPADDHGAPVDRAAGPEPRADRSAADVLAAGGLRGGDAGRLGLLDRPARQPGGLQATGAAGHRPARLPAVPRTAGAAGGGRDHHHRRGQRDLRHRPIPDPELRSSRAAAARNARALHDLLGAADAGRVRGGVAGDVREAPSRVGGGGPAGAPVRAGVHVHAQRVGRRVRRDRPALPAARLPADGAAAGGAGGVPRARAVGADDAGSIRPSA